jgi:hypothetical protein
MQSGEVTTYQDFVDRSSVGDNLQGHELWQHPNLKSQGLANGRLSTDASKENPVKALDRQVPQQVNAAQRKLDAAAQSPVESINANAQILRNLNAAPVSDIERFRQLALRHAVEYGFIEPGL